MTLEEAIEIFQNDTSETILNLSELRSDELADWLIELSKYRQFTEKCNEAYDKGRKDAFDVMIAKCKEYSYIVHSSEFAKLLQNWKEDISNKERENE